MIGSVFMCIAISYIFKGGIMLKNNQELWQKLDDLNIAKVFILFTVKKTKKNPELLTNIQSIMVTTNCGNNQIDWENDVYSDESYLTKPIQLEFSSLDGKVDGMLVYNCGTRTVELSGTLTKKIREKFKRNLG